MRAIIQDKIDDVIKFCKFILFTVIAISRGKNGGIHNTQIMELYYPVYPIFHVTN